MKRCNICDVEMRSLDRHHILSRTYGGSNKESNLVQICPNCHRRVHLGEIIIEGWFTTNTGRQLIWRKDGVESISGRKDPKAFTIFDK